MAVLNATFRVDGVIASLNAFSHAVAISTENLSFAAGVEPITPVALSIALSKECL